MDKIKKREYLQEAKKRMKSGYWQEVVIRRNNELNTARLNGDNPERIIAKYRHELYSTFGSKVLPYKDEDKLFEKIKLMHASPTVVTDPIGRLTDVNYYNSLDESDRERYVLELANAYRRLKARLNDNEYNL